MSSYFPEQKIIQTKAKDFTLDKDLKFNLKEKVISFVLFVDSSRNSQKMQVIWAKLAKTIAGAKFSLCDLQTEIDVANTLNEIINNHNSEHREFLTDTLPFILCYRNGSVKEKYSGVMSEYDIRNWCLQLISGSDTNYSTYISEGDIDVNGESNKA